MKTKKIEKFFKLTDIKAIYLMIIFFMMVLFDILVSSLKVWSWDHIVYAILTFGGYWQILIPFLSGASTPLRNLGASISFFVILLGLHYIFISFIVWVYNNLRNIYNKDTNKLNKKH